MMIAIFRANPHAFEGNINLLHRGALLRIPSAEEASAISATDARREVRAQMNAWRLKGRPEAPRLREVNHAAARASTAPSATPSATPSAAPAPSAAPQPADAATTALLKDRVQSLEQALGDVRKQVASETTEIDDLKQLVERPAAGPQPPADIPSPAPLTSNAALLGAIGAGLALLLAGFAYVRRRLLPVRPKPAASTAAVQTKIDEPVAATREEPKAAPVAEIVKKLPLVAPAKPEERETPHPAAIEDSHDYTAVDIEALEKSYLVSEMAAFSEAHQRAIEDTAILETDAAENIAEVGAVDSAAADNGPGDRVATVQHLQMPSHLEDRSVIVERRKNVTDVLKSALEREPHRRDLRMKLLETYHGAAATNQRAFIDAVRQLSRQRDLLSEDDWNRVTAMGRMIAPDDILFAGRSADEDVASDEDLADCA